MVRREGRSGVGRSVMVENQRAPGARSADNSSPARSALNPDIPMTEPAIALQAVVPDASAGRRFDAVLAELFPQYSRSRLAAWIKRSEERRVGKEGRSRRSEDR